MNELIRGVIIRNFLYLIVFYIIYFPMVATAGYVKDTMCAVDIFSAYCTAIPASTTSALNFLLYVAVPISAFIWTFTASAEPQQVYYPRS